jgi:Immunity protein 35
MMNSEQAKELAVTKILQDWNIENDEPVILDEFTIEKDFGWVFFYDSHKFIETKETSYRIFGNAPVIVNRFDGSTHYTGTARETEYYIAEYETSLRSGSLRNFMKNLFQK